MDNHKHYYLTWIFFLNFEEGAKKTCASHEFRLFLYFINRNKMEDDAYMDGGDNDGLFDAPNEVSRRFNSNGFSTLDRERNNIRFTDRRFIYFLHG